MYIPSKFISPDCCGGKHTAFFLSSSSCNTTGIHTQRSFFAPCESHRKRWIVSPQLQWISKKAHTFPTCLVSFVFALWYLHLFQVTACHVKSSSLCHYRCPNMSCLLVSFNSSPSICEHVLCTFSKSMSITKTKRVLYISPNMPAKVFLRFFMVSSSSLLAVRAAMAGCMGGAWGPPWAGLCWGFPPWALGMLCDICCDG